MSMQLCLVNNDPTSTLLIASTGEPLYSITTPTPTGLTAASTGTLVHQFEPRQISTTTVNRLDRCNSSTGHVETTVGNVEYQGHEFGTQIQMCVNDHRLAIGPTYTKGQLENAPALQNGCEHSEEHREGTLAVPDNSWEFMGPDNKRYRWQMFIQSPILILVDNSLIPLARYRRAKIGIVSRSRKAFLEILPVGIGIIDLIVVTFVAFMKQRVTIEGHADAVRVDGEQSTQLVVPRGQHYTGYPKTPSAEITAA